MSDFNFRMLILARESRGLTQAELAKRTSTNQGNLSKIEKGFLKPTEEVLLKYAEQLSYPLSFFFQNSSKTVISDFFYRKRITMPAKEKTKLEAQIDILRIVYDKLLKSVEIPESRFPSAAASKYFTPRDIANLAREFYQLPKGPIINLIGTLEKNGIAVVYLNVESTKFDGMTVYTDSNYPMIVLNTNMPNDRKRFTLAHELGHQIMHLPYRFDFELYERLKSDPHALESEADMFASEFLMPSDECFIELKNLTYGKLSQLKSYWRVSKKAIIYRAKTCKAIEEAKFTNLMIELSRMGERVKESFDVEIDEPKIFKQIMTAFRNHLNYSNEEILEYLSISEKDLSELERINTNTKLRIAI